MKKLFGCLLACGVILILVLLLTGTLPAASLFIMMLFTDWRGPFEKPRFQAVVEEVERRGINPGDRLRLHLDRMDDPGSLRPQRDEDRDRGAGTGNVLAIRKPGGELIVVIETKDHGHAGEYGYAYSEIPPSTQANSKLFRLDPEENLSCTDPDWEIEKNWWKVQACEW